MSWSFPKMMNIDTNLDMASLLNNHEAADNNTKKPDPTNLVDEDKVVT